MARALISGAAGFLGTHLLAELAGDFELVGVDVVERPPGAAVEWRRVGSGAGELAAAVADEDPDLLVHAAFVNKRPAGWSDEEYLSRQLAVDLPLFRRCAARATRVLLISSSAVYGAGGTSAALAEDAPRRPVSLYGLAKSLQEMLAELAATAHGLELCTARLFNLVGPGQGPGMVVPDWIARVAAIADGAEPVLRVDNRATHRDFVDVRDAARAIGLLARRFAPGEAYNVASGRAVSLRELSELLETLSPVPYRTVESDPRPPSSDARHQHGDATKIRAAHGWRPAIDWRQSVRDSWEHHRSARKPT